jgi:hypothetical protein
MSSASPEEFFGNLNVLEKSTVEKWRQKRLGIIQRRVREEAEAELETDVTLVRKSTPFLRVKLHSVHPSTSKCEMAMLTIWEPTEEQMNVLKEGTTVEVKNLGVNEAVYEGMLQLKGNHRTILESIDLHDTSLAERLGYAKRRWLSLRKAGLTLTQLVFN